jgi:hypothetical protein
VLRVPTLIALILLPPGCGDDDGAAVDAAPPDAAAAVDYCVTYDGASCIWNPTWTVSPDHASFPMYNLTLRVAPGQDGLDATVRLSAADGTQLSAQEVGLSYDPSSGGSEGLFMLRFCLAGAADGQATTLASAVRRADGSAYAMRTDVLTVVCSGSTCADVCSAP